VESGFSVKAEFLVKNLREESLIPQRRVYDSIKSAGGVLNISINKDLLQMARGTRSRYDFVGVSLVENIVIIYVLFVQIPFRIGRKTDNRVESEERQTWRPK
jgi:hypothetical protein